MILLHRNIITESFLDDTIRNNEALLYRKVMLDDNLSLDKISNSIMYYDKCFVEISMKYDYRALIAVCDMETPDIRLILVFDNYDDYTKSKNIIENRVKKLRCVSFKTIDPIKVKIYIRDYFKTVGARELKNPLIDKIYRYLYHRANINRELTILGSMKTLAEIQEHVQDTWRVRPNNFAYSLLSGTSDKKMGSFMLEYSSSLNYLITILKNYLQDLIKFYDIIYENDITLSNFGQLYVTNEDLNKKVKYRQAVKFMKLVSKADYWYYYQLLEDINQAKTKFQKQKILMELLLL